LAEPVRIVAQEIFLAKCGRSVMARTERISQSEANPRRAITQTRVRYLFLIALLLPF
jgi:hypothetical protein